LLFDERQLIDVIASARLHELKRTISNKAFFFCPIEQNGGLQAAVLFDQYKYIF